MSKYNTLMSKISVTPEMRARVLQNLAAAGFEPEARPEPKQSSPIVFFARWKSTIALAACTALLLAGALAVPSLLGRQSGLPSVSQSQSVGSQSHAQREQQSASQPESGGTAQSEAGSESLAASRRPFALYGTPDALTGGSDSPLLGGPNDGTVSIIACETRAQLEMAVGYSVEGAKALPFVTRKVEYTACSGSIAQIEYTGSNGQQACWRKSRGSTDNSGLNMQAETAENFSLGSKNVTLLGSEDSYSLAWWTDGEYSYSLALSECLTRAEWEQLLARI